MLMQARRPLTMMCCTTAAQSCRWRLRSIRIRSSRSRLSQLLQATRRGWHAPPCGARRANTHACKACAGALSTRRTCAPRADPVARQASRAAKGTIVKGEHGCAGIDRKALSIRKQADVLLSAHAVRQHNHWWWPAAAAAAALWQVQPGLQQLAMAGDADNAPRELRRVLRPRAVNVAAVPREAAVDSLPWQRCGMRGSDPASAGEGRRRRRTRTGRLLLLPRTCQHRCCSSQHRQPRGPDDAHSLLGRAGHGGWCEAAQGRQSWRNNERQLPTGVVRLVWLTPATEPLRCRDGAMGWAAARDRG